MKTSNFYILIVLAALLSACDRPIKNPELKDPIYLDILSSIEKTKKDIESKKKEYIGYEQEFIGYPDNHFEKKIARENMKNSKAELERLSQTLKYYEISAESRQIFSRKQYLEYYKTGQAWPPKNAFEKYTDNKQIREKYKKSWMRGLSSEINMLKSPDSKEKSKSSPKN